MKTNDRKKTYLILAITFIAVFMGGAFLLNKILQGNDLISIGSDDTAVLESKRLFDNPLNPGDREECKINVKMDTERQVEIRVWFSDYSNVEKEVIFSNSIYVGLKVEDQVIESKPMSEYTDESPLITETSLGGENSDFYLIFEMPIWVGNEMLDVYSEFNINIEVEGGFNE